MGAGEVLKESECTPVDGGSTPLLLSVPTFQSQLDCFPWLAGRAHRPPPLFLIPASLGTRRMGQAPLGHLESGGVGVGQGPVLQAQGRSPHQPPPGECNKALTFLRGCLRDLIKEGEENWLALRNGWGWGGHWVPSGPGPRDWMGSSEK